MRGRTSVLKIARSVVRHPNAETPPVAGPDAVRSIGVVFVHGIGTQPPSETLLRWANPIVELLAVWRREYDEGTKPAPPIGEDPVASPPA